MKKSRFTEEQIVAALKLAEAGSKVGEVCRKLGVSEQTFYRWKQKYGGMEVSDARRLKALEEENRRLKKLVADQALDMQILKEVLAKDSMKWPAYPRGQGGCDGPRRDRSRRQGIADLRAQPRGGYSMGGALGHVANRGVCARLPHSRMVLETCAEAFAVADAIAAAGHEGRVVPCSLVRSLG